MGKFNIKVNYNIDNTGDSEIISEDAKGNKKRFPIRIHSEEVLNKIIDAQKKWKEKFI